MPEIPMELGEWLEQHDGSDPEIYSENDQHFLVVPFADEDGAADAYTYKIENLSGELHNVGGE